MTNPTLNQILDAVIAGDPRIASFWARELPVPTLTTHANGIAEHDDGAPLTAAEVADARLAMDDINHPEIPDSSDDSAWSREYVFGDPQPVRDIEPLSITHHENGWVTTISRAVVDADAEPLSSHDAPPEIIVIEPNRGLDRVDAEAAVKLSQDLSDMLAEAGINPDTLPPLATPQTARQKRLARLTVKAVDTSSHENGGAGVKPWTEAEATFYKRLPSNERRKVWVTLRGINVTYDQPSCYDLAALSGVSHQTCSKVLPVYRDFHGITQG